MDLKARYLEQIDALRGRGLAEALSDSMQEFATYDNHPADIGSETFERGKDLGLLQNSQILLEGVNGALDRLGDQDREGAVDFGVCTSCGRPIERERVLAAPYVEQCLECAHQSAERREHTDPRPAEETVLAPPFARTFLDGADNVVYDGEDAWQDVARYGTSNSPQDVPDAIDYDETFINADEPVGTVEITDGIIDLDRHDYPELEDYGEPIPQPPHDRGHNDSEEPGEGCGCDTDDDDSENVLEHIYPDPNEDQSRRAHQLRMKGTRPEG